VIERVAAIVLAAGEGRRFGGPKALARLEGESWLTIAVERLRAAGIGRISVVVGAAAEQVIAEHDLDVSWVLNEQWNLGRSRSVARGLSDLPASYAGALIHPVDFPLVRASSFRILGERFDADPERAGRILVPIQGGHRGHPIVVGRDVWPEVLELGDDEPLRFVVRRDPKRVIEVEVDDPGIHRDINTAAALREGKQP
jgi:CTP:molybdopterin cytidylyltransferase MocA